MKKQIQHTINRYLFDGERYDGANLFIMQYDALPSRVALAGVDGKCICKMMEAEFKESIRERLVFSELGDRARKEQSDTSYYLLDGRLLVEVGSDRCFIFYTAESDQAVFWRLKQRLQRVARQAKRRPLEMNMISQGRFGLYLKRLEVKRSRLQIGMYYNDDFGPVDELIRKRLNGKRDKGIVLLHGAPGTGKTSYLRHLMGKIRKRVLYISPENAGRIASPEFIELLSDYPECVLIIEDAEQIIMQRQGGGESGVSNLLNLSDGLLSDFLNVQLICTFNSALSAVDEALLRKGRLIARYEFGKLTVEKAQRLSDTLGFQTLIDKPMTVAEIANQNEFETVPSQRRFIGFRRELLEQ